MQSTLAATLLQYKAEYYGKIYMGSYKIFRTGAAIYKAVVVA
jgi:hypothetical protein